MSQLSESAYATRILIKYGSVAIVGLMVGRILLGGLIQWWKATHPKDPDPPSVGFGILPQLVFPKKTLPELSYKLETVTGSLPYITDQLPVYKIPLEKPNLLALEDATSQAERLGFKETPVKISDTRYQWKHTYPIPTTLDYQIYTGLFKYSVAWEADPTYFMEKRLPNEKQAEQDLRNYLQRAKIIAEDLSLGEAKFGYLKARVGTFVETVSLSEADFVRVDLFRKPVLNQFEVVTADPDKGIVRGVLSGNQNSKIVFIDFNYVPVDYAMTETYPLKTTQQAWDELLAGKGYVANIKQGFRETVVRRVNIGYYDSYDPQHYLQPVYIFEGDNDFKAYVPAVRPPKDEFVDDLQQNRPQR